jgi:hypothetical protein
MIKILKYGVTVFSQDDKNYKALALRLGIANQYPILEVLVIYDAAKYSGYNAVEVYRYVRGKIAEDITPIWIISDNYLPRDECVRIIDILKEKPNVVDVIVNYIHDEDSELSYTLDTCTDASYPVLLDLLKTTFVFKPDNKIANLAEKYEIAYRALSRIAYPLVAMRVDATKEDAVLNGVMAVKIAQNAEWYKTEAKRFLAQLDKLD